VISVFSFLDYRAFLQSYQESRKADKDWYSVRYMAGRIEMDPGQLVKVLQGKLHLPLARIPAISKLCRFDGREEAFFETLVRLGRAKTRGEIQELTERIVALRGVDVKGLEADQAEYFHNWHHAVVRSLAGIVPFRGGYDAIGEMITPRVSGEKIKESVELLSRLGLLREDDKGFWRLAEPHVHPGEKMPAEVVRRFQGQNMRLAERALEEIPVDERDISSLTVTLKWSDLPRMREKVSEIRRQIQTLAQDCSEPDGVFQLNVQLFPVARVRGKAS
jgi:uncharacterized protein (TIGR02147 family)